MDIRVGAGGASTSLLSKQRAFAYWGLSRVRAWGGIMVRNVWFGGGVPVISHLYCGPALTNLEFINLLRARLSQPSHTA